MPLRQSETELSYVLAELIPQRNKQTSVRETRKQSINKQYIICISLSFMFYVSTKALIVVMSVEYYTLIPRCEKIQM